MSSSDGAESGAAAQPLELGANEDDSDDSNYCEIFPYFTPTSTEGKPNYVFKCRVDGEFNCEAVQSKVRTETYCLLTET